MTFFRKLASFEDDIDFRGELAAPDSVNYGDYVRIEPETKAAFRVAGATLCIGDLSFGTSYKVKTGQYSNTVTVTGKDQGTGILVSATDTNYHLGVSGPVSMAAPAPVPVMASLPTQSATQTLVSQAPTAPIVVQSLAVNATQPPDAMTAQKPVALVTDADVVRTLSVSRTTDLPWSGVNSLVNALSGPAPLSPADVTLKGSNGVDYTPVSVSGAGSPYTINLGRSITQDLSDDRAMILILGRRGEVH